MSRFQRVKRWYLNIGVRVDDSGITVDNAQTLNIFILLIQLICLISLIAGVLLNIPPITGSMAVMIVSLCLILFTQYNYYYLLSYYLFVIVGCLAVCYLSYSIEYTGIHFYIISGLAVASIVYLKKRYHIHFFFIIGFFTFVATLWLSENSPNQMQLSQPVQLGWLMFNVLSSFVLVYLSGYFYTKSVLKQREISKTANALVETQLQENQTLLKELNHRVKNNFQVISSLVAIQSREIQDEQAQKVVVEGQKRLKAMALIHQELYQNDDLRINIEDFINLLIENIHTAYASHPITYRLDITPNTTFDADTSIPLGLIINELITNSFKYAVNTTEATSIRIGLFQSNDEYILSISDNGPGIESREEFLESRSLGLKLVKSLVKQLQGSVTYETVGGASFQITFKDSRNRNEID